MEYEDVCREQVDIAEKKYKDLTAKFVDLLSKNSALSDEIERLKANADVQGNCDGENCASALELKHRIEDSASLRKESKEKDEQIVFMKLQLDQLRKAQEMQDEKKDNQTQELKERINLLERKLEMTELDSQQIETRIAVEVSKRLNEEVSKRTVSLSTAIDELHQKLRVQSAQRSDSASSGAVAHLERALKQKETEIRTLNQVLEEKDAALEDAVNVVEAYKCQYEEYARRIRELQTELTSKSKEFSKNGISPGTETALTLENVQSSMESALSKFLGRSNQRPYNPNKQRLHRSPSSISHKAFSKGRIGAGLDRPEPSKGIPNLWSSLQLQKTDPLSTPGAYKSFSEGVQKKLDRDMRENNGNFRKGMDLLGLMQSTPKYKIPSVPKTVTSSTEYTKVNPSNASKGSGSPMKVPLKNELGLFADSFRPILSYGKTFPTNQVAHSKSTTSVERSFPARKTPLEECIDVVQNLPPKEVFVLIIASKKLNLMNSALSEPSVVEKLLMSKSLLGTKPVSRTHHGTISVQVNRQIYQVGVTLSLETQAERQWVVKSFQICFPKLRSTDSIKSFGQCLVCLKFCSGGDSDGAPSFFKTFEFVAQQGTCNEAAAFHQDCQNATYIIGEKHSTTDRLIYYQNCQDSPPSVEIDLHLLTQEAHFDNAQRIEEKRKQQCKLFKAESHSNCPEIKLMLKDSKKEFAKACPHLFLEFAPIMNALWLQSMFNDCKNTEVAIPDRFVDILGDFCDFCYGEPLTRDQNKLMLLLEFALEFFVADLAQMCVEALSPTSGR